jgi:DNA-binding transcriptional ArsR family regulator|tara:strand:+ start:1579 stop:1827 length:249 start_codon:yes stop_codon:yes gene_type:complete
MALEERPLNVSEISKNLKEEQSKISHNLKKLTACHILEVKQKGKQRIYSLNKKTVVPMLKIVGEHVRNNCLIKNCPKKCEND